MWGLVYAKNRNMYNNNMMMNKSRSVIVFIKSAYIEVESEPWNEVAKAEAFENNDVTPHAQWTIVIFSQIIVCQCLIMHTLASGP